MKKDFDSRFMPDVYFKISGDLSKIHDVVDIDYLKLGFSYFYVSYCGYKLFPVKEYQKQGLKEVSIYEAIPELIPDGMRYNKELDKLVSDVVSVADEYCSGIKVEFEKVVDYTKENISCKNEKSKHYELWSDFEAIDVLKNCLNLEEYVGFLKGNILKYQLRLGKKDDVSKELEKIKDYKNELDFILKEMNAK